MKRQFILICTIIILIPVIFFMCASRPDARKEITPAERESLVQEQYKEVQRKINKGSINYLGGDGLMTGNAIVISGAKNEAEAAIAGLLYISDKHGKRDKDWTLISQNTLSKSDKILAAISISDNIKGADVTYYFNITEYVNP